MVSLFTLVVAGSALNLPVVDPRLTSHIDCPDVSCLELDPAPVVEAIDSTTEGSQALNDGT